MGTRRDGSDDAERERTSVAPPASGASSRPVRGDLSYLVDVLPDAVAVFRDNAFVYANAALVTLLGYRDETEVLASPVDAHVGSAWASWSTKARRGAVPECWLRADGKRVYVELTLSPLEQGGVVVVARDVTERWQEQVESQQTDRLAALGTLATSIAHQINNPLTYLLTNANFVREEVPAFLEEVLSGRLDEEALRRRAEELRIASSDAHDGAQRVAAVVRELRSLARGGDPAGMRDVELQAALDPPPSEREPAR